MKSIDFLPKRYQLRQQQRRAFTWEICVVIFFAMLITPIAMWQVAQRWQVGTRLQALSEQYQQALDTQTAHQKLQVQLASASEAAELYLYLEHPWPRTQVLHAISSCLPEDMWLTDVHITYEAVSGVALQSGAAPQVDEAKLAKLSPTQRDLNRLRREADRRATLVWISGTADDASHVYDFVHRLGQTAPFATVKLETVENESSTANQKTTFRLRSLLKPGYGQPGGPQGDQIARVAPVQ